MREGTLPRRVLLRGGLRLEYLSLGYNFIEAFVGIAAGVVAGSVALLGFGLDSVVEASSASVLVWRLQAEMQNSSRSEEVERKAIRAVAVAFLALAAYVIVQALYDLFTGARPEASRAGVILACASLIVMPILAQKKRAAARRLRSRSLMADASQTTLCTYLSGFLLIGLAANGLFGWWWADPVAALFIGGLAAREGRTLWMTKDLCC
jgi:divalent metal cation (Fe/Co/Zn/Cd) transporter